jgi:hypothetical protein
MYSMACRSINYFGVQLTNWLTDLWGTPYFMSIGYVRLSIRFWIADKSDSMLCKMWKGTLKVLHIGFMTCYYVQQDQKFVPFS